MPTSLSLNEIDLVLTVPLGRIRLACDDERMRLMLVRHGQTPANVERSLDTFLPGPGLTDLGARQAEALVEALAGQDVQAVFASEATRAQLTAQPLAAARGLPVQVLPGVFEVQAGALERRTDETSITAYITTLQLWRDGDLDASTPGGEDGHQMLERVDAAVGSVCDRGLESAVLVSHGALIRTWSGLRCTGTGDLAAEPLDNTGIVTLEGDQSSGWRLVSWQKTPAGGLVDDLPDTAEADPTGAG
ncbi:histidine phosphatase family protein [Allobranchiibius sp. GilTou38]|uniref:histidine phosphatase family protein n=1 Tax=Allobranchiibius sp. GilTou38 TaxID=2815210 RepID=UPI00326122A2